MTAAPPAAKATAPAPAAPERPRRPPRLPAGLAIVLALLVLYGLYLLHVVRQVKEFRRSPVRSVAYQHLRGWWPHDLLATYLIFYPGEASYQAAVRRWAYQPGAVRDTAWHRWLLQRDMASMSIDHRIAFLPGFPLDPALARPYLEDALLFRAEGCRLIPLLADDEQGRRLVARWQELYLPAGLDEEGLSRCLPALLEAPVPVAAEALRAVWPRLDADAVSHLMFELRRRLDPDAASAPRLLDWLDERLAAGEIPPFETATLLGRLLSARRPEVAERAFGVYARHRREIHPATAEEILLSIDGERQPEVSRRLFLLERDDRPDVAVLYFGSMAAWSVSEAEEAARDVLAGEDSELRKGIIIQLVNHGSRLGLTHLDDAFRGPAPRRHLIADHNDYIVGSAATSRYEEIAGHGYRETGKLWPPAHADELDPQRQIRLWREFLADYPWFPGADDAFYRLAYQLYRAGEHGEALRVIFDFCGRDLPDRDAERFLTRLLFRLREERPDLAAASPELQHLDRLADLGVQAVRPQPDLDAYLESLAWLDERPDVRSCLDIDVELLELITTAVATLRGAEPRSRYTALTGLVQGSYAFEERFAEVFYGHERWLAGEFSQPSIHGRLRTAATLLESWAAEEEDAAVVAGLRRWHELHCALLPEELSAAFQAEASSVAARPPGPGRSQPARSGAS